jgi:hypothetical protein
MAGDGVPQEQLDQVELFLGAPLEDAFTFLQDVGVGASFDGEKLQLGLAATVTDEAIATQRVAALVTAARLGAATGAAPVNVTETEVAGVTVTTISMSDGVPEDLPMDASISVAVSDGVLLLGTGDFASDALQRDRASSLAGDARFSEAMSSAGTTNAGFFYVDIADARGALESAGARDATYDVEVKPYVEPFESFVFSVGSSSEMLSVRAQLFVQ